VGTEAGTKVGGLVEKMAVGTAQRERMGRRELELEEEEEEEKEEKEEP
jgi:hypothetical protein